MAMSATAYKFWANVITVFHFFWTFLVFGGAVYVIFDHAYAWKHIMVLSITLISNIPFKAVCPLTLIEESLRRKIDPAYTSQGSFTTTYTNKIFGTNFSTREINTGIAILYILSYSYSFYILYY